MARLGNAGEITMPFWRRVRDADPSTFEKLEGVGLEAYGKRQSETPLSELMKRARAEPEYRLEALMTDIVNRVNVKPVLCINPDNGDVYVHRELAHELEKPINEDLRFAAGSVGRMGRAMRQEQFESER
jgi:hypothetical protein